MRVWTQPRIPIPIGLLRSCDFGVIWGGVNNVTKGFRVLVGGWGTVLSSKVLLAPVNLIVLLCCAVLCFIPCV